MRPAYITTTRVAHLGDHAEVVGDQQDRHAELVAAGAQQVEDLRLDGDVERGGRLVGDQQRGPAGERHGDHHPLAQAARQLVRILREAPLGRADADHAAAARARPRAPRLAPGRGACAAPRSIWKPTVKVGLREVIGSWKIMPMRSPRTSRIARSPSVEQVPPVEHDAAGVDPAGGSGSSRMIASAVTHLPQPDSPTRPTISPASSVNDTSSTTRTGPSSVRNDTVGIDLERSGGSDGVAAPRAGAASRAGHSKTTRGK